MDGGEISSYQFLQVSFSLAFRRGMPFLIAIVGMRETILYDKAMANPADQLRHQNEVIPQDLRRDDKALCRNRNHRHYLA